MNIKSISITIFIIGIFSAFLTWQNNGVVVTSYKYKNEKIPKEFDGYRILHISDLHNKNFYGRLTDKIKKINPDIILITGDLIDRRKTKINIATQFIKEIIEIAPTYYVSGNHEQLSEYYNVLKEELYKHNVIILDNSSVTLNKNGVEIGLMGLCDPALVKRAEKYLEINKYKYVENNLKNLYKNTYNDFNILLSHRPELFDIYKKMEVDLVFSGHAHGGQIRLPFLGGILSPDQGFFPKYAEGMITEKETSMVVSRGLGNSIFPFRIFNRPELVVVDLRKN